MKETTRVYIKGLLLGLGAAVLAGVIKYFEANGMPTTKTQWMAVLATAGSFAGLYIVATLKGLSLGSTTTEDAPSEEEVPTE